MAADGMGVWKLGHGGRAGSPKGINGADRSRTMGTPGWPLAGFLLILFLLAYPVVLPVFKPLCLGWILAFSLKGVHRRICGWINMPGLTAGLLVILSALAVTAPVAYGAYLLGGEIQGLLGAMAGMGPVDASSLYAELLRRMGPLLGLLPWGGDLGALEGYLKDLAVFLVQQGVRLSGAMVSGISSLVYDGGLGAFMGFFMLKDWDRLALGVRNHLPLPGHRRDLFLLKSSRVMRSVIVGSILTGLIQGTLGWIGWHLSGLPNGAAAGLGMFAASFIPLVGTALVWLPGGLYLLLTGSPKAGIFLLLWGATGVSGLDQFIRPVLMSSNREDGTSTLLMITGVIGGLSAFGLPGLFLGPVALHALMLGIQMGLSNLPDGGCKKAKTDLESPHHEDD
ncbi:putative permease [Thermanaerovibrio velox DSM 12556]|uniref:Putative permease n=1 Tax=Thermanaerovibrio velox DSM 12556 TaxID=926567 RepID=H0UR65_9BACT|nr:AI-2E family transporter [Thermanaerovibrio velox]EHM10902.1 putative permease [Thermanaerovibrio velox DSM 12556]